MLRAAPLPPIPLVAHRLPPHLSGGGGAGGGRGHGDPVVRGGQVPQHVVLQPQALRGKSIRPSPRFQQSLSRPRLPTESSSWARLAAADVVSCVRCVRVLVQFKSFSQRVEEIDIDVYRSLHEVKAEPSSGSSFFLDALVEWRVSPLHPSLASVLQLFLVNTRTLRAAEMLNVVLRSLRKA
jgi:hypothetical protein